MGKTNIVVRLLFIFFNLLFTIAGCVLLGLTVKVTVDIYQETPAFAGFPPLVLAWLFSFAVIGVSVLGVYGAVKEARIPLIVFAVFMGIATVTMAAFGFQAVATFNQVKYGLGRDFPETNITLQTVGNVVYGCYFGIAAVSCVGMLMSILMVHQIKRKERSAEAFLPLRTTSGDTHLVDVNY